MAKYTFIRQIRYKYKKTGETSNKGSTMYYELNMAVDLSRFEGQYSKAQYSLDSMVMSSMEPFMPMETGTFIKVTKAMSQAVAGSGMVYAAAPPFGRYLYFGQVMVDEATGSTYARRGARKVLVSQFGGKTNAQTEIQFSKAAHPRVEKEWFEAAKKTSGHKWLEKVQRIAGGGVKRG